MTVGVSLPPLPCLQVGNSEFVASTAAQGSPWELPMTSRNGNGLGGSWGVRAMGLVWKNPNQPTENKFPARGRSSHETQEAEPPQNTSSLPSFSTPALCASKLRNHRIHLPCPPLRYNSQLSLFGQGEEEEWCPGWVWQLMLLLWGEINCKLDCAPSSEFSLIYGILPLFTHSKGSYNFNSLKPAILTPKQALTELPEGKVGLEIFWQCIFNCSSLQKQTTFTSFKTIHMSIFVSVPSNANHSAFKSCTNTEQALVTGYTKKKQTILQPIPQPTGTPPCDPAFFRFPLEVQLGIRSLPHSNSDRQIWCDMNVAGSLFPGTQWRSCFLQFRNCSGLITKPMESGKDFGLVLGHIY